MVSLARKTLIYEWRRFLPAVFAVAFSGVLVLIQLGLLLGIFGTVSVYIDQSNADLWVGFRDTPSVDLARNFSADNEVFIRMNPEVAAVEQFYFGMGDWRRPDGVVVSGFLVGVDTRENAMAFAKLLTPNLRAKLREPDSVIIDKADMDKLGVRVGERAEINGKGVKIVATITGLRAIGGANIITSLSTARRIDNALQDADQAAYLLVKLRHPLLAETVRDKLEPQGGLRRYSVWTAQQFSMQSQVYWLLESGAGAGFMFSSILGLAVGVVITSQTLMAAILGSLREYASLRALGVSLGSLRAIVLEQSTWVGVVGLIITAIATAGVVGLAHTYYVAITLPWWAQLITAVLIILIASGSGLFALRTLSQAEPATLLR
jgi:putative ABC transport system permease protein